MTVAIVSDSAAALPPDLTTRFGIVTVPMELELGGVAVHEADVTMEELAPHLDEAVKTSGPSPGAFVEAIDGADHGDGVVVLTVSERYSSTYGSAMAASTLVDAAHDVRVVDTTSAAGGEGLVVLAAAQAAADGRPVDEVVARARVVASRIRLVAAVADLRYLIRGGRIPASAAKLGTQLGVHILFELRPSGPRPLRPSLNHHGAVDRLLGQWRRTRDPHRALHIASLHAMAPDEAEHLLAAVRHEIEPATAFVGTFGPVMVAHTGPGVIGLAWWWE